MIYIMVPSKVKIANLSYLQDYKDVMVLFQRHGLGISEFGDELISFYEISKCANNKVPVDSFFRMSRKEFSILVNIVKRLDESERTKNQLMKVFSTGNLLSDRRKYE
jgi:hypothetical protein